MSKTRELRYQAAKELRVQTSPDGSRTISGSILYNQPSQDLGGFTEILSPGVFNGSLDGDILCLRDHSATLLMGRTKSKTLVLTDDAVGLRFRCTLPDTSQANDLAASIERGDLDGVSFGFRTIEDAWTSDGDGNIIRTLLKVTLFEISPCSFPAYPSSTVSVRSCPPQLRDKLKTTNRSNEDGCDCDCSSCVGDDCEGCTMQDCDDEECAANGCPYQDDEDRSVSQSEWLKMHMRLELARRK
jgi:HK97 family phage prohead protease